MNWPDDYVNQIICGDCLEFMKGMPDDRIVDERVDELCTSLADKMSGEP